MLQIFKDGIKVHVRINNKWVIWSAEKLGLLFPHELDLSNWHHAILTCDKKTVLIQIKTKNKIILDRTWGIPSGEMNVLFKRPEISEPEWFIPYSVDLDYGTIGFRNYDAEEALVRNLLIKKISR